MVEGLRRIKFHDHQRAWGIDRNGAILVTNDQGESWLPTYVGLETAAELIAQRKQADMEAEADNAQEPQSAITNPLDDNFTDIFQRDMTEQRSRAGRFTPEGEIESDAEGTAIAQTETETENRERPTRRRRVSVNLGCQSQMCISSVPNTRGRLAMRGISITLKMVDRRGNVNSASNLMISVIFFS